MNLSRKIKNCRKENQMTQEEFARVLNVSRKTVSGWENGRSLPDITTMIIISKKFDISLDDLLKDENTANYYQTNVKKLKQIGKISKVLYFILWLLIPLAYLQFFELFILPFHITTIGLVVSLTVYVVINPNNFRINSLRRTLFFFFLLMIFILLNSFLFGIFSDSSLINSIHQLIGFIDDMIILDALISFTLIVLICNTSKLFLRKIRNHFYNVVIFFC